MATPAPIYTAENCNFACPLQWGLSAFWRQPVDDDGWLQDLAQELDKDGIRILGHRFQEARVSQFCISTTPKVAPKLIVQRVKGRLQHLLQKQMPKAWKRNFAIRSVGHVTREVIENYVESQVCHHPMADPNVQERLEQFQIVRSSIDLSKPQRTSHGLFWHNLHLVLVHRDRCYELQEQVLQSVHDTILGVSEAKRYLLSRGGILPDHVHLSLGCPFETAPADVALAFLNNLAFAHGMRPVYQFGAFVGTVGEYTHHAMVSDDRVRVAQA